MLLARCGAKCSTMLPAARRCRASVNDCQDCQRHSGKVRLLTRGGWRYPGRKLSLASRRIAEWAVWSIVLAGGTIVLQAQKKGGASHGAPAAHEHSAAPQKQEHKPTPMRERASPAPEHPPAHSQGRTFGNHPPQTPRVPNSAARQTFLNAAPAHSGGTVTQRPATHIVTTPHGDSIHRSSSGQVREVHLSSGATVYHPPGGPRRVELARPGGRVVMASAPGHGYVQRPIVVRNTTIIKRTYIRERCSDGAVLPAAHV